MSLQSVAVSLRFLISSSLLNFIFVLSPLPVQSLDEGLVVHRIEWTPEGVKDYNSSHPLEVELGDVLSLTCSSQGPYAYSNLVIQYHEDQYNQCNCMTQSLISCDDKQKNGFCAVELGENITVKINHNAADLNSVVNFDSGTQYYLMSYSSATSLAGIGQDVLSGGQCLQGLKMSIRVAETPTTVPPTTISDKTSSPTPAVASTTTATTTNQTDTSGNPGTHGPVTPGYVGSYQSSTASEQSAIPQVKISPSKNIKDWHIAVIAIGGSIVLLFLFGLAISVVVITRRRGSLSEVGPSSDKEEKGGVERKGDEKSEFVGTSTVENVFVTQDSRQSNLYPQGVFEDPIDNVNNS